MVIRAVRYVNGYLEVPLELVPPISLQGVVVAELREEGAILRIRSQFFELLLWMLSVNRPDRFAGCFYACLRAIYELA